MNGELPAWLSWLKPVWDLFDQTGPLANFLQIGGALLGGGTGAYLFLCRRISDKETELASLRNDLADRDRRLHAKAAEAREFQERCAQLEQRLAVTALIA